VEEEKGDYTTTTMSRSRESIIYDRDIVFVFRRDNLSGGMEECVEPHLPAMLADDVCPWDLADGGGGSGDKNKRPLPASIAEERERRLSTTSSRKNSGGAAYDSAASADESQSDSVASRLRRSCGLGGGGGSTDRRRGSSAACTPQQTVDRPSVSSAEDFDLGPSPESRSPEKQPSTSPHEPAVVASTLDDKLNRKKLLKSLSLARKQSVTPVINVSSVDRDNGCDRTAADTIDETTAATVADGVTSTAGSGPGCGSGHPPETVACCSGAEGATATATAAASISDGNDVCPWEDE